KKITLALMVVPVALVAAPTPTAPTIEQFLAPGYPTEIVSAKKADRIAWTAYEHGLRNVYTAAAPEFKAVRLANVLKDDGVELSDVAISDDGSVVTFVRGTQPNREGWIANPTSTSTGAERTVWAVKTVGGVPIRIGEVTTPALSPDGQTVVFSRDGQIYRYSTSAPAVRLKPDPTPLVKAWGNNSNPVWSPDGTRIAFISNRSDHSFVGVYDTRTKDLRFLSPSVDHDTSPTWSPDGKRVAFIRRPGTPFGEQAHQGQGSIGNPDGPAFNPLNALRNGGRGGRGGRSSTGSGRAGEGDAGARDSRPGLYNATFAGGYNLSFWVADASTGEAKEFWHNQKDEKDFTNINGIGWTDAEHVIFEAEPQEWARYYSVSVS